MDLVDSIIRLAASRRILVLGSSGSGKTTFSIQLARILKLPLIHLDGRFWQAGWVSTPQPEWRLKVAELIHQESWIMDGTYESTLELRLSAADSVIVLERSRLVCLWRVLKRKLLTDDQRRPDAPAGQKLDLAFLRYVWRYPRDSRPIIQSCLQAHGMDKVCITIRKPREMTQLLDVLATIVPRQDLGLTHITESSGNTSATSS